MQSGYRPLKPNHKDYDFHQSFGSVVPAQFPTQFNVDAGLWMPDQNIPQTFAITGQDTLYLPALPFGCTDYSQTDLCMDEDVRLLNPLDLENITHANANGGADIRTALKAAIQAFGRTAYFNIKRADGLDWFDSIRLVMLSTPEEKRAVSIGIPWYGSFEQPQNGVLPMPTPGEPYSWHNAVVVGWDARGLKVKSWQGPAYGDQGYCYMPRALINSLLDIPGTCAFTISKMAPKQVVTIDLSYIQWFVSLILNLLRMNIPQPTVPQNVPPQPSQDAQTTPAPDTLVTDWNKPSNAFHNARVLCDQAGLSLDQKNLICACIFQESRFDNAAVCHNKNAAGQVVSSDWGIVQVNDFYHIGPGRDFPSVQYVLSNPGKAVAWMISMYQHGLLKQWVSYSSGAYEQWLAPTSPMWDLGKQFSFT